MVFDPLEPLLSAFLGRLAQSQEALFGAGGAAAEGADAARARPRAHGAELSEAPQVQPGERGLANVEGATTWTPGSTSP